MGVPRRNKTPRTVEINLPLDVIDPGFGRTGTLSLKLALEQLGLGPCHHMDEVFKNPLQVADWQAVAAGQKMDWDAVFAGYRSQVDWPGAHVWRELSAHYPTAKVVLTARPEEAWLKSFSATIGTLLRGYEQQSMPPHVTAMMMASKAMIVDQTFGGSVLDEGNLLAAYRKRIADVRAAIAPERLLVFNVADGWAPLCSFLGVAAPETPFPRVNSSVEFWELIHGRPQPN